MKKKIVQKQTNRKRDFTKEERIKRRKYSINDIDVAIRTQQLHSTIIEENRYCRIEWALCREK